MRYMKNIRSISSLVLLVAQSVFAQVSGNGTTSMAFPEPQMFAQTRLYRELVLPMHLTMQDPNSTEHKNGKDCRPLACYITGGRPYVFFVIANLGPRPDKFRAMRFEVLDRADKVLRSFDCKMDVDFPSGEINNYNMRWDALGQLTPGQYTVRTTVNPAERPLDPGIATSCRYGFTVWSRDRKLPAVDFKQYRMISTDVLNEIVAKYGKGLLSSLLVYNEFRGVNLDNPPPPTSVLPLDPETYDLDWTTLLDVYGQANRTDEAQTSSRSVERSVNSHSGNGQFVDTTSLWREAEAEVMAKSSADVRPGSNTFASGSFQRWLATVKVYNEKFDRLAPPEQKAMVNRNIQLFMAGGGVQQWKQQREQNSRLFCPRTGSDGAPHGYYNVGMGCPKCKGEVNYTPKFRGTGYNAIVAPPATGHACGFTDTLLIKANQCR